MNKIPWFSICVVLTAWVGFAVTSNEFHGHKVTYASLLLVMVLSMYFAEMRLAHVLSADIALIMTGLVFFSSYYLKFFLIAIDPESPVRMGMLTHLSVPDPMISKALVKALAPKLVFDITATHLKSLSVCTLGIVGWSMAVFLIPTTKAKLSTVNSKYSPLTPHMLYLTLVIVIILSIFLSFVSYKYDIGVMGKEVTKILPFRLRGVVFYLNNYFLTGLVLMVIYSAYKSKRFFIFGLALLILFINGFINFTISSSKSTILWPALMVIFLVVSSDIKIGYKYWAALFLSAFSILLFLPYMHYFRVARLSGHAAWESIWLAISSAQFEPVGLFLKSLVWIIYRLPGVDIVAGIFGHNGVPLGSRMMEVFMSKNGVAGYLTNDVFMIPVFQQHMNAPGYWGWWYLVLGFFGVFLGGVLLGLFVRRVWPLVLMSKLASAPVLKVFTLMILFTIVSEGTIDSMLKVIAAMFCTIIFLEFYIRHFAQLGDKLISQITKIFGKKL